MLRLFDRLVAPPIWLHGLCVFVAFVVFGQVQGVLDVSYAASGHPMDYATGQTTFDAERIKGFYAVMQEAGTLDVYDRTQLIDFGFIASRCSG